jgi:hypothetical protein
MGRNVRECASCGGVIAFRVLRCGLSTLTVVFPAVFGAVGVLSGI